jgi:outer membrane protein insertion porin family
VKVARVNVNFRWAMWVIAAMLAFSAPAVAQRGGAAAPSGTITAVQIQGNVRAEAETIRSYLQLKEGQPLRRRGRRPLAQGTVLDRPVL